MVNETSDRRGSPPREHAPGIVEEVGLIHERGVAGTTLEDVKVAAGVSGSQMYRYFPDTNELVQAVIDYQAGTIVKHNRQALGSPKGVEAWRKIVVTGVREHLREGGLPTWFARRPVGRE